MEGFSEKIQDYIEGSLTHEEMIAFENQLHVDSELRTMVKLQREVYEILNYRLNSKEVELRNTLIDASQKTRFGAVRNVLNYRKIASIAAVIVTVLFGSLWLFKSNHNDLFELPVMQSEVVRGDLTNDDYEDAVRFYNATNYTKAADVLEKLITKEPSTIQFQYYYALCFIGNKKWDIASNKLSTIANGESIFADEAKYYAALANYELGKLSVAANYLNQIKDDSKLAAKILQLKKKLD